MNDKIRELRIHEPNANLVEWGERFLEDAKSGRLQSIVGVVVFENGNTSDIWIMAPDGYPVQIHSDRMIGCIERIKFQLIAHRHGIDTEDCYTPPDAA